MPITSSHNDKLKEIRRLARRRSREDASRFVAEGEDLVAAAAAAGWEPLVLLTAAGSGLDGDEVEPALLETVSGLGSGSRQIGVYEQRWSAPSGPLCVALWGVGDPGNVGTILRSARAFGASSVALGPGCADPFGPKAVRASMGAIFEMPVARVGVASTSCRASGSRSWRTPATRWRGPARGDADGARRRRARRAARGRRRRVRPRRPHPDRDESLNVAMAATIALYELSRHA